MADEPVNTPLEPAPEGARARTRKAPKRKWPSPMALAACASIGAGGIHAAAIGTHAEHQVLAMLFVWSASIQVVWGIAVLLRPSTPLAVAGLAAHAVLTGAWFVTRVTGISWIGGLEEREPIAFADAACAGLAVVAIGITLGVLLTPGAIKDRRIANLSVPAFVVAALALPAMVTGGTTIHEHDDLTPHGHSTDIEGDTGTTAVPAVVPPKPYDPTKPIDLGGVDGVTPEQQARAENLVAITVMRLPRFADYRTAETGGWRSVGDAITGYEHFINWSLIDDNDTLNPDAPESLVYRVGPNGARTLVSAMFVLPPSVTLETVPDIGGRLTQWHVHNDLCITDDPTAPRVAGITTPSGSCPPPLERFPPAAMIHVWIVPHPCGPFAALEGVGAGQVKEGETRWCDHTHGSTGANL